MTRFLLISEEFLRSYLLLLRMVLVSLPIDVTAQRNLCHIVGYTLGGAKFLSVICKNSLDV
jgi:hypothetical protein